MNRFRLTIVSLFMLVIFSCDKSNTDETGSIYGKWEVTDFISVESKLYPKKDDFNPVIEIKIGGTYNLKLDMNSCTGNFTLSDGNSISLSASGCTKMCCDSEFSQKFVLMLPQIKSFQFEGKILKLVIPGWGWINLELYD